MTISTLILTIGAVYCQSTQAFMAPHNDRLTMRTTVLTAMSDVHVMVNGMPGPMATAAAEACLRKGLKLAPSAMTGPEIETCTITVSDPVTGKSANVRLVPSPDVDEIVSTIAGMRQAVGEENLFVIDFTHPSAVNGNARFYVEHKLPFVMGTTGGDRSKLLEDVKGHNCVIAPNMAKQIVAMQSALEDLATKYPGAFDGYKLQVTESHQKTKADTSGTGLAVIDSIQKLANDKDFSTSDIEMIRDEQKALDFGVPPHAMNGHGFHTYTLRSSDGSVQFQLKHNVAGRTVYAEGTVDALKFLSKKVHEGNPSQVYSMINVLEEGALE